ncbi:MAG: ribosome biogenesis GTP-binding protein YihA/YsxC [Acidimicrobiia bacterium]|nr:ribosome biogenesis GTP-binding protein YihA/YsxC [Acidimicrobiia bacterium]
MSSVLQLSFIQSADRVDRLPPSESEVAFVGRSNVGKSSLINALANHRQLAHVSKTPGRTRLLNLFEVRGAGTLMDLPGYGYAQAPPDMRARWQRMIEDYLLDRENLVMVAVLVDGEVGPTNLDIQMLEWLRANLLPHTVIATKHDKVKPSLRGKRRRELAERCDLDPDDPIWVSASKGTGIDRLRGLILTWLG